MNSHTLIRTEEPFLIIGAGSSGTTLLSMLLDKHPLIACGPELSIFNKRKIYIDFKKFQYYFPLWLQRGLSTDGQAEYREFFFNLDAYFFQRDDIITLVRKAHGYREFFDCFFARYLTKRGKSIWGEKTGSNTYCVREFVKLYPKARIIHLVRDGRDAVCSLMRRPQNSAFHSVSHWLYNVSAAIAYKDMDRYLEVRYEDLVRNPHNILIRVCHHLGVDFDERMLSPNRNSYWEKYSDGNVHQSWSKSPFSKVISTYSVGRYKRDLPNDVAALFWRVHLTPFAKKRLFVQHDSTIDLMRLLGYEIKVPYKTPNVNAEHYCTAIKEWYLRFNHELRLEHRLWLPLTWIRSFN